MSLHLSYTERTCLKNFFVSDTSRLKYPSIDVWESAGCISLEPWERSESMHGILFKA